jgi:hypothetical protein
MPVSKHRKNHKQKKTQRRQEFDLKRHRTQVFAAKINEAIRAHKEQEELDAQMPMAASLPPGLSPLPATEITLDDFNKI